MIPSDPFVSAGEAKDWVTKANKADELLILLVDHKESETAAITARNRNAPVQRCVPKQEFIVTSWEYQLEPRCDLLWPNPAAVRISSQEAIFVFTEMLAAQLAFVSNRDGVQPTDRVFLGKIRMQVVAREREPLTF
jgi:hypothetical protein